MIKVGLGVDVHAFEEGRPCILGGVVIPHPRGLTGHSDADALVHAIMDALLGAVGERDIGHFFPNTDARWKDADSLHLLAKVRETLAARKAAIHNVDATLIAQEPKLAPHLPVMLENLSRVLGIPAGRIAVKATTCEWMGFVGRKEGVVALAVACVDTE
ncbi:MAG: 2-C-methyl-D-erythritol 2,4-cyclodiphosphate synthase [Verrucomicrobiae bacterium]|nr:2-C-methyl-D-erythritol 2,4-cyclodiphosphate synthase [Verrucomicrobiae bacterium]